MPTLVILVYASQVKPVLFLPLHTVRLKGGVGTCTSSGQKTIILGTGSVGKAIGGKLVELGYEVLMGSRTRDNAEARQWAESQGKKAGHSTFAEAAEFGRVIFLATKGDATLDVLDLAKPENLAGKTSSIWETSLQPGTWRCSCRSGCGSGRCTSTRISGSRS